MCVFHPSTSASCAPRRHLGAPAGQQLPTHPRAQLEEQLDVWRDTLPPPAKLHLDAWLPSHTPLANA